MDYSTISILRLLQYLEEGGYTRLVQGNPLGMKLEDDPIFQEIKHRIYRLDSNFTELEKLMKSEHLIFDEEK